MIFYDCNRFIETSMRQGEREERKREWTRLNGAAACNDRDHCVAETAAEHTSQAIECR